jgi:hypothetical protein
MKMASKNIGAVYVKHPHYAVSVGVTVSYDPDPEAYGGDYLSTATVVMTTGAASVQFYAPAATLRELAAVLLRAADAVDAGVNAAKQVTPAEAA